MKSVNSTSKILAFKALGKPFDKEWVNWSVEMLMAGYETENLILLAAESPPYDQFELEHLTNKIFEELHLDYSDKDKAIKNYVSDLINNALINKNDILKILEILKDIYDESNHKSYLRDFWTLYYAKDSLIDSGVQWYWQGANALNIDQIIKETFEKWKLSNPASSNGA
jgi:hypothetical protein